jgi:hypothetical protein
MRIIPTAKANAVAEPVARLLLAFIFVTYGTPASTGLVLSRHNAE